ncbi:Tfp pilus assembly protein PilF [Algoriphagus aquaeductus]|uniref:Tfp pilus assembly protein PilF n=1 Tax=Algoriphagus aquaeductus TaxID=475299 RepID=A0A326RWE7_9BACT|nr:tetratricopeptide repeat protein [Algoriphagus aquaeductus]PZV86165.1 Tfp pilus assembly protein PilF [Algoriphagus aquaeductus]
MRTCCFLLLFFLMAKSLAQQIVPDPQRRKVGLDAYEKNDLQLAFVLLDSWLRDHPNDGEIYLYRGRIRERFKEYDFAEIDLTAYLTFFPEQGEVYLERGRIRYLQKRYELAKEDFNAYLKLPRGETTQIIYQKSATGSGFSRMFTPQTPNPAHAYYHLGLCSMQLKEYTQSLTYLDSAIYYQPDDPDFYSEKGKVLALMGEKTEAKTNYLRALELNPDHFISRQRMVFLSQNTDEEALEELTLAIASAPENPETYKQRGFYRLSHQDPKGAKEDFLEAILLDPNDDQIWFYLGKSWVDLKNFRESERAFAKALELDPQNVEVLLTRGQSRYRMNEFRSALADFTLVTFYDPNLASGYYHKGITIHRISGGKSACADLKKAMEMGMPEAQTAWNKICRAN